VPPFVGDALNVIGVLVHTLFADAVIDTAGVTVPVTVIVIGLLVAVCGLTQLAFDVNVQVMMSPFCKVLSV
jgi:hypothetical protein